MNHDHKIASMDVASSSATIGSVMKNQGMRAVLGKACPLDIVLTEEILSAVQRITKRYVCSVVDPRRRKPK